MNDVVITGTLRTAVGKFSGSLATVAAADLGAQVIKALLARTGVEPDQVSEVILGQVLTAGAGQNPARQALIRAGIPDRVPAMTVGKVCGSGMKATHLAAQAIRCGDADIVIAGGQENMSASPHVLPGSRDGFRMGDAKLIDTMIVDGLWDAYNHYHMGTTAENVAQKYGISRPDQDEFAARSQQKAEAAQKAGRFKDEVTPVEIVSRKGTITFEADEYLRYGTTAESLGKLKPAFSKDGTVTVGAPAVAAPPVAAPAVGPQHHRQLAGKCARIIERVRRQARVFDAGRGHGSGSGEQAVPRKGGLGASRARSDGN